MDASLQRFQGMLKNLGFDPGSLDGEWGKRTSTAAELALAALGRATGKSPVGPSSPTKYRKLLLASWLPTVRMDRIILHWTGGAYTVSNLDKEHYHFILSGDAEVVRGDHSIAGNVSPLGDYAAHTLNCNSGSIGVAIAAMAGAVESPFNAGNFPLSMRQWDTIADVVAQLCDTYGIKVTPTTVLTHAEVQPNLHIQQRGKWDIARLPFAPHLIGPKACGDDFRKRVQALL